MPAPTNGSHATPCTLTWCRRPSCRRTRLRCERAYCDNLATLSAHRVDASRDYWYLCDMHRISEPTVFEQRRLADLPDYLPLASVLAMWPPKHRTVTRDAARAIVAVAEGR